jgi:tRNA:m(5)U-54 methyltransferase
LPSGRCAPSACATRAPAGGHTPWSSSVRTTRPRACTTWSASRPINTFLNAPALLEPTLRDRQRADLWFAGQITGIEGYTGNAASGIVAGVNAARHLLGRPTAPLPRDTMLGALCHYVAGAEPTHFQPMKANLGLLPELPDPPRGKAERRAAYAARAGAALESFLAGERWLAPAVAA